MAATDATDPHVIVDESGCQALHRRNSCLLQRLKGLRVRSVACNFLMPVGTVY